MSSRVHAQLREVPEQAPAESTPAQPIPLTGRRRRRAFLRRLAQMSTEQRLAPARGGRFTRAERTLWAARYPEEAPLVNGEYEWIALGLADLD